MGRVFGTCNVTARAVTILAPMVAEAADPTPELIMVISCVIAAILTKFLRKPDQKANSAKAEKNIEMAEAQIAGVIDQYSSTITSPMHT